MTLPRLRTSIALAALLAAAAHLAWEASHGGVRTHHLLQSASMPGFSNFWGLLILPALGGWAGWRVERRLAAGARPAGVLLAGGIALALGLALSAAFLSGSEDLSLAVFVTIGALALLGPGYRAECGLGLMLGMFVIFGPVIPTLIGGVLTAISAILHRLLWPLLQRAWTARRAGQAT
jgi:hypothetical protein